MTREMKQCPAAEDVIPLRQLWLTEVHPYFETDALLKLYQPCLSIILENDNNKGPSLTWQTWEGVSAQ